MSDGTHIEWTDATWNPVTGCSVVSPGCTNCYAMRLAGTRLAHHPSRAGLTQDTKSGPVWNGQVRLNEQWLDQPLRRRKARRIFVCAHGDLFHESVPDEWIDRVFAVMALAPQHQFQVLTKRAARMRDYLGMRAGDWQMVWPDANPPGSLPISRHEQRLAMQGRGWPDAILRPTFPLPNVWLGVSCEDQRRADERIPDLLATPAAVRFVSAEPLLGPINLTHLNLGDERLDALAGYRARHGDESDIFDTGRGLDWIIVGGESGPGARPMHPAWARSIRDQCIAAGVPFFFKQWGSWLPTSGVDVYCHGPGHNEREFPQAQGIAWLKDGRICMRDFSVADHRKRIAAGEARDTRAIEHDLRALKDFHRSVEDPHRREHNPLRFQWMYEVGKARAGRLLDGVEHNGMPGGEHE